MLLCCPVLCFADMPQVTAQACKRIRDLAMNLGFTLAEEGRMDLSSRKEMFEIEVQ